MQLVEKMSDDQCRILLGRLRNGKKAGAEEDSETHPRVPEGEATGAKACGDMIRDMDVGVLVIETTRAFSVGERIVLTMIFPDRQKPTKIVGTIVETEPTRIGVKFKKPTRDVEISFRVGRRPQAARASKERRRGPRVDFHCPVLIEEFQGAYTITDISLKGAFIECEKGPESTLELGQMLHLLIKLPTEPMPTEVNAQVVNLRKRGVGCRFIGLCRKSEDAIHRCFNVASHSLPIS
jgi:Tfp pilus assembly protein PilZ